MTIQLPIPDYAAARQAMVDSQLRPQGVSDPLVVEAMGKVEREQFVPEDGRPLAYLDRAVPIGEGRALLPPDALGLLLTAIAPRPGQKALVVGAGTGYSAAVLTEIGLDVTPLESSSDLARHAQAVGIKPVQGPLEHGVAKGAPYDLILIDGAIEHLPDTLAEQLRDGGFIAYAAIDRGVTRLTVGRKAGGAIGTRTIADSAVSPLPGFARSPAFTF
jgi:protein-L-isoaspartate(D-aspartate) O-methyltransferase